MTKPLKNQTEMKTNSYLLLLLFCAQLTWAQTFVGYETDNFNGIHGILVNPGNVTLQKNRNEINLLSVGGTVSNDFAELTPTDVLNIITGDFDPTLLPNGMIGDNNTAYGNLEAIGPSFIRDFSGRYDGVLSFGAYTRFRKISNQRNVNGNLFTGLVSQFPNENFTINQDSLRGTTHAWSEVGGTLGYRINRYTNSDHIENFKFGISVKWLRGVQVELDTSRVITGDYLAGTSQLNLNGDLGQLRLGSGEIDEVSNSIGQGLGIDLGFVYERQTSTSTEPDVEDDDRALNQYRYKFGVSVLDIGRINYGDVVLDNYVLDGTVNTNDFQGDANYIQVLRANGFQAEPTSNKLKMGLPTRLRLEADWKFRPNWYVNAVGNLSLVNKDNLANNHVINSATLTVRRETRKFSAYLPITLSEFGGLEVSGLGVDAGIGFNVFGVIHVGSGTIFTSLLAGNETMNNTANFYVGLKVPRSWLQWEERDRR